MALPKPPMWARTPCRTGSSAAQRSPFCATCGFVRAIRPMKQEKATRTVLEQAEVLFVGWAE